MHLEQNLLERKRIVIDGSKNAGEHIQNGELDDGIEGEKGLRSYEIAMAEEIQPADTLRKGNLPLSKVI